MLRNSGKPAVQISHELGCSADSMRTWKRKYDNPLENCIDPEKLSPGELKHENARLRKELDYVTQQRDIVKKVRCHFEAMKTQEKYQAITRLKSEMLSLSMLCNL